MKILIIEDEAAAVNRLKQLVHQYLPQAEIVGDIDSIESSVKWLHSHTSPDLIFCDIHLADGLSFEIFEQVESTPPIIFTTAYDQYAIKAFKLNSVDYLLKPVNEAEFEKAIDKFKSRQLGSTLDVNQLKRLLLSHEDQYKSRFLVKFGEKIQSIAVSDIAFFFSQEKITFLRLFENKKYVLDYTLDQLEGMIDPNMFFRLNRKYLVSFSSIREIHTYSNSRLKIKLVNCEDGDILVSREKTGAFKEWLDR